MLVDFFPLASFYCATVSNCKRLYFHPILFGGWFVGRIKQKTNEQISSKHGQNRPDYLLLWIRIKGQIQDVFSRLL